VTISFSRRILVHWVNFQSSETNAVTSPRT